MCVYIYINTHISIYTTYIQLYMYSYMRIYIFVCFCLVNNRMVATKTLRNCPSKNECPFISKYMT